VFHFRLMLLVVLVVGCESQPPVGTVAGSMTLNGNPVTGCSVLFEPENGGATVFSPLDENGRYAVRMYNAGGLSPGKYRVAVAFGSGAVDWAVVGIEPKTMKTAQPLSIPAKYQNFQTSGLIIDVKPGINPDFNFDLRK